MTCPVCGSKSTVKDTGSDVDIIVRKRICLAQECKYVFYTIETECNNAEAEILLNQLRKKAKNANNN